MLPAVASKANNISLPLKFDDTKPETACKISGTAATCIVDTGAALARYYPPHLSEQIQRIQPPWFAGAYRGASSSGGLSEVRYAPVSSLQIGPQEFGNVNTLFTTAGNGALAFYPSPLVGNRIWQDFTPTFDYQNGLSGLSRNSGS